MNQPKNKDKLQYLEAPRTREGEEKSETNETVFRIQENEEESLRRYAVTVSSSPLLHGRHNNSQV